MKNLLLALVFAFFATQAMAATTPNSIILGQTPMRSGTQFLPASTPGVYSTVYTAGASGSKVVGLWTDNNDTVTHVLTCQIVNATIKYGLVTITTVANAGFGTGATPTQNMLLNTSLVGLPVDSDGNPFIYLVPGDTIQCTYATAVTASDQIDIKAIGFDF